MRAVLRDARSMATELGTVVCLDHALIVACGSPLVRQAIAAEDGDADAWALALRTDLHRAPPPRSSTDEPRSAWGDVLFSIVGRRDHPTLQTMPALLAAVFGPTTLRWTAAARRERESLDGTLGSDGMAPRAPYRAHEVAAPSHPDQVLRDAGVTFEDVFAHVVHGEACAEVALVEGPAAAWLFNDEFTHESFVVDALREVFAFSLEDAMQIITQVNRRGAAELERGDGPALRPRAQAMVDRAREHGYPLLLDIFEER